MKHVIPHTLLPALAKKVTDRAFEEYRNEYAEYHPLLAWTSEQRAQVSFRVKGILLEGWLGISDRNIELDLDAPFIFRIFQRKAIEVIDREVRRWIDRADTL